ncbi:hypothetical protein CYFUS_004230 [Cystobacter fuscus]|uniref:Uncharacterized protein n=2 Tax=Cystobacter fuscus TaxID=43 RepID=A0A250J4A9_9BACT|nr:hypothetical protein CYFUS_004230 [Cystobacter fuscus]
MAACSGDGFFPFLPDPDEETPLLPGSCQVDQDCPDPRLFICDTAEARCKPACRTREDCTAARRGTAYRISACDENPLGCQCDANQCVEAMCSADEACAASGRVCRDGRCTSASGARARTCRVTPDHVVGRVGSRVRFSLLAWDETGAPVAVEPAAQRWTALEASVSVDVGGASSFVLSAPTSEARETVRAEVGGAVCTARVRVLEAPEPGRMRVVVTDEQTGRPIAGARVVVADAVGAVVGQALTDEGGVALPPGGVEAGSVSVFHEGFDYLTVAHAGETGPMDLSLPLRRNPIERIGGFEGTVQVLSEHLTMVGVVGLSSPDEGPSAAASSLLAPERQVDFISASQQRLATLPAGAFAVLAGSNLRELEVQGRGSAGVCDEEPRTREGTCGVRTAWGLGGELPLNALQLGGGVDVGSLLARVTPSLGTFKSWVVRDARFTLEEGAGAFTRLAPDFSAGRSMALGFPFVLDVPSLPGHQGRYMDRVWVLGSARVPGRGGVPLGLGLGMNTAPADPNTDTQPGLSAPGLVRVRMAPTHHGLEGSPYVLHLTASSPEGAVSGLIHRSLAALPFDPTGAAPVEIEGPFLPVPEGARYSPVDDEGGRRLRPPPAPALPPGTVLRAVFSNRAGRRWGVLLDASRDSEGVRLPLPPAPLEDRTFQGNHLGSFASLELQAWSLREGGLPDGGLLPLEALTRDENLSRLGELVVAWSALEATP